MVAILVSTQLREYLMRPISDGYENLLQATKITEEKETNDVLQGNVVMGNGTGFYNQYSPHLGDVFNDLM
ncbi:hypothetical protein A4A49_27069 [Nicotiana attenuata]|uniref:Uncharacterized protein n=1 Tax=Nicotiana attenuata TaxID=49451 RepID=A0A1J6KNF3_NICAT|nr:hypothetical protein A4A49_27069 [Nicotiana attenuata]